MEGDGLNTGQGLRGKNTGWRAAVRFARCENPVARARAQQRGGLIAGLDGDDKGRAGLKCVRQGMIFEFVDG